MYFLCVYTVTLYDCSRGEASCSTCLAANIGTGFDCGWCSSLDECTISEECSSEFATTSFQCPDPVVDSFFPMSGPPEGGTTITILGTDLGITYSQIENSVFLNSEYICETQEARYIPGRQIVCNTPNFGNLATPVVFNITVMLIQDGSRLIAVEFPFTVTKPSVTSIFPAFGPIAGGTLITIRGSNLDIGNVEETHVTLNGKECIIQ